MTPLKPMNYQENYLDLLPEGSFRISPSSVAKFTEKKWEWYQENAVSYTHLTLPTNREV